MLAGLGDRRAVAGDGGIVPSAGVQEFPSWQFFTFLFFSLIFEYQASFDSKLPHMGFDPDW